MFFQGFKKKTDAKSDGVVVSIHPDPKITSLIVHDVIVYIESKDKEETLNKKREETNEKYSGILGRKYAIVFYEITPEGTINITDFFRAVLIDPFYYVKNLLVKDGVMAAVAEEFTLNEKWTSKLSAEEDKESDFGLFCRMVEFVDVFWKGCLNKQQQASKEHFSELNK